MMKCTVLVALVFLAVVATQELYTSEFDSVDVQEILSNQRLFLSYVDCLKGKKTCTKSGLKLKELLPEALKTGCTKCTETQKKKGREVIDFIIEKHPQIFLDLEKIYDPDRAYRTKYADRLKAAGIQLPQ